MSEQDRIRLAEAMGIPTCTPLTDDKLPHTFDPFTDANDDYAVLEWARQRHRAGDQRFYPNGFRGMFGWAYKVGDYARAALKVLNKGEEK